MWLVRDLGSTNGTKVNGKPVKETLLADGDILKLAEAELTFVASASSQFQRMVTQPVQSKAGTATPNMIPAEVASTRMLCEATLWQVLHIQILPALSMRHGSTEALFAQPTSSGIHGFSLEHCHEIAGRYRLLQWLYAVERATAYAEGNRLFLPIDPKEIESPHQLLTSITQIQERMPEGWEVGITISIPVDVDILRIASVHRQAKDHGILVAFDQFRGNGGQVMHFESLPPDYLVLDPNMTKDLTSTRQPLRRLESLLTACEDLDIKVILPTIGSSHVVTLCQEIGFDLILQAARRTAVDHSASLAVSV